MQRWHDATRTTGSSDRARRNNNQCIEQTPLTRPSPSHVTASAVHHRPTLLGIASAHPPFEVTQEETSAILPARVDGPVREADRRIDQGQETPDHVGPGQVAGSQWSADR